MSSEAPARSMRQDSGQNSVAVDTIDIESRVDGIRRRWPSVGLAVGVIQGESLQHLRGFGVADIESRAPITEDTIFRIASITKTFTAIAVMQLWERGLVDLDAPANDYLRAFELMPEEPAWPHATTRHLLTHTAGLGEVAHPEGVFMPDFGESVEAGRPLPTLAEFYRGGPRLHAEPGTRFVYNNHGPATLGQLVEDVSGEPLDHYFWEHIFEPLGMVDTDLLRTEKIESRRATGYEIRSRGVEEVNERDMVTAGAASIYSTPRDMARYLTALLAGGGNQHGSILAPQTLAMMFQPHYQPDPRLPGIGLGFFRHDLDGRLAVGHQGTHPGFHSQILLGPAAEVAVMTFTNGARQADFWLPSEASRLLGHLIGLADVKRRANFPHHPETWDDICGWYKLPARLTDVRLRAMMGAGAEVLVRSGQPTLRFLSPVPAMAKGFPLLPDAENDPHLYRIEPFGRELNPMRVLFGQGPDGTTTRLHFDVMPLTLHKQPASKNPRLWVGGAVGALGLAAAAGAIRCRLGR